MIFLDTDGRVPRLVRTVPFYGREIAVNDRVASRALAMQEAADALISVLLQLEMAPIGTVPETAEKEFERVWEQLTEIVDTRNGRNVPQHAGESAELTQSVPDIAVATSTPSPSRSKRKG